ncbi:Alpha-ketoglutarate-dependent dioxygenase alkB-like protein 6 [Aphelenchoides bicaudatus]|nr:Alpha-ketoglutarate-dependent dioxygenase alkB-like protein 6 [Aphelenchoides bicaudatus]
MAVVWDANQFVVEDAPVKICYIPDYLSDQEETCILKEIEATPSSKWVNIDGRSKQDWNYQLDPSGDVVGENLPKWVSFVYHCFMSIQNALPIDHKTNFMRANMYTPGQGIPPHVDSRATSDVNVLISLSSTALLDFYVHEDIGKRYVGSMFLGPRSLLLIGGHAYTNLLHGIKETDHDLITEKVFNRPGHLEIGSSIKRDVRYSLTMGWYAKYD